jgi:hemoglobin-like flavoprotein
LIAASWEIIMDIRESLDQVLASKEILLREFYRRFLERHPELRQHFAGVNMTVQSLMLTMALAGVVRNYLGHSPALEGYLRYLGTKHHQVGVPEDSFVKFRESLLATLEHFHQQDWSPELAAEWDKALEQATKTMLEGYRQDFYV